MTITITITMTMTIKFDWNVKEKPEDFIVREVAEHKFNEEGNFYLYRLIKKNLNTREVCEDLNLSYAGLKDKNAITFQFITSKQDLGEHLFKQISKDKFFILSLIGKTSKKLKIGQLQGNYFSINLKSRNVSIKNSMINYFDTQRLSKNVEEGRKFFKNFKISGKTRKKLKWKINFYIDAYLSYLWNKSFEIYLKERFSGYFLEENGHNFFIPEEIKTESLPKFWTILGYKVKLEESENYYRTILEKEGISIEDLLEMLSVLRIKGDYRKSYINLSDVKLSGGYIHFFLPKGAYATMYLKHIFQT